MPDIEFPTSAGSAPGYLAAPAGEHGPGVIVLQEWWGVDEHIRSICDRLAAEGFYALAPDLYRGETTTQPSEAQQKMMALSMGEVEQDMCGAADYLAAQPGFEGPGVGAVGFCLGGGLAVWAAATCPNIAAAVTLLLRDAPRQARLQRDQRPRARPLRHRRRIHPDRGREQARGRAEGRRRRHDLPLLRRRRARVLQRHQPPRHLRPRARRASWGRTVDFLRSALAS